MTQRGEVPRRIKKGGTSFKGLSIREVMISAIGLSLAIIAAVALVGLPIWLRAGLAVLIAGVSLALAFGTHRGQKVEELLFHWITHLRRPRRMVWRRGGDQIPDVVTETTGERETEPEDRSEEPGTDDEVAPGPLGPLAGRAQRDWLPLGYALVNAVMLAAMTSITVYLADGGAAELKAWWVYKMR